MFLRVQKLENYTIIFSRIQLGGGKEIHKQILPAGFHPQV
jgi:hypothetical protein